MRLLALFPAMLMLILLPIISIGGETPAADTPITFDKPPEPVGGMAALLSSIKYPESAKKDNIQGTVLVNLTIGANGTVTKAEIQQGVHKDLDKAALDALRSTVWVPAQKDNKPVETMVTVPVKFKLDDKKKK